MGDIQFNGTQEEWDALVEKNKTTQVFPKQQEISDEEIYKESFKKESPIWHEGFIAGAKWYREQLKSKGNGES